MKRLAWQTANIMNALGANVSPDDILGTKPVPMSRDDFEALKKQML